MLAFGLMISFGHNSRGRRTLVALALCWVTLAASGEVPGGPALQPAPGSEPLPSIVLLAGLAPGRLTGIASGGQLLAGINSNGKAFRWNRATGAIDVFSPPDPTMQVASAIISADGSTVAGAAVSGAGPPLFRWTTDAPDAVELGLPAGTFWGGNVWGLSNDGRVAVGSVIVGTASGSAGAPVRWTGSVPELLSPLRLSNSLVPRFEGQAFAVSADGSVAAGELPDDSGFVRPVVWTDLGREFLADPAGFRGQSVLAISADGTYLAGGGVLDEPLAPGDRTRVFRQGPAGTEILDDLPYGERMAISPDGRWIFSGTPGVLFVPGPGFVTPVRAITGGFVWTEDGGTRELFAYLATNGIAGLDGWRVRSITAISSDAGWVAGTAFSPTDVAYDFIAPLTPVPLPGALWLLGTALAAWLGTSARVRRP